MFTVTYTKTFIKHLRTLPKSVQIKTDDQVGILAVDFRDSRLHTKKLQVNEDMYSFRVSRDYRVVFIFETGSEIKLVDIQHRKDIYRNLS